MHIKFNWFNLYSIRLKIIKEVDLDNRVLGLVILLASSAGAIAFALFVDGAAGGFGNFISLPSFIFVLGVGVGFSYMRKHTLKEKEFGTALKNDFAIAGWLGTIVGLILMGSGYDTISDLPGIGLSAALVTVLYGYVLGAIAEAFLSE